MAMRSGLAMLALGVLILVTTACAREPELEPAKVPVVADTTEVWACIFVVSSTDLVSGRQEREARNVRLRVGESELIDIQHGTRFPLAHNDESGVIAITGFDAPRANNERSLEATLWVLDRRSGKLYQSSVGADGVALGIQGNCVREAAQ